MRPLWLLNVERERERERKDMDIICFFKTFLKNDICYDFFFLHFYFIIFRGGIKPNEKCIFFFTVKHLQLGRNEAIEDKKWLQVIMYTFFNQLVCGCWSKDSELLISLSSCLSFMKMNNFANFIGGLVNFVSHDF